MVLMLHADELVAVVVLVFGFTGALCFWLINTFDVNDLVV